MKKNPLASFVTLTYGTEHVPITEKRRMSLDFKHVTLFLKRLRIKQERKHNALFSRGVVTKYFGKKISYYIAGEYGTKYSRPHYHAIFFNADPDCVIKAWEYGTLYFGTVTRASVGYTLKYISKDAKIPQYKGDDRVPESQRMSKGIGLDYISGNSLHYHLSDLFGRCYMHVPKTEIKVAMPRYYKERIYTSLERQKIGEAMQSKHLEKDCWGSLPDDVENLLHKNPEQYFKLQYERFKVDTEKNSLSFQKDSIF